MVVNRGEFMKQETLEKIILLSENNKYKGIKTKKLYDQSCDLIAKANGDYYYESGKTGRALLLSKVFITMLRGLYQEEVDIKKREKAISSIFSISKDKVTGDYTKFIQSEQKYPIFVNDFQYDASISLSRLKKLKMVWGDANLQKLHDFENLSLEIVMGNVYTSTACNTKKMNLKVVTGDLHIEDLKEMPNLNSLIYVGGKIYTKDGIISLDEFKQKTKQMIK